MVEGSENGGRGYKDDQFGDLHKVEKFLVLPPWELLQTWHRGRRYEPGMRHGD